MADLIMFFSENEFGIVFEDKKGEVEILSTEEAQSRVMQDELGKVAYYEESDSFAIVLNNKELAISLL